MIQGTYYKEWSSVLNREMEFKVYGSAGVPVLALPARGGRFYDWENNGMPDATAELAPRVLALNGAAKDAKLWCVGIDLGAVHAVNCRLRRPQQFAGAIGLSGIYDLARFWGSEKDDLVLRSSPLLYLGEKGIANKLTLAKAEENSLMLCAGQGAYEDDAKADTQALADLLQAEGLPAHLELWGGDVSHEWYWWGKMLGLFVPRILEK